MGAPHGFHRRCCRRRGGHAIEGAGEVAKKYRIDPRSPVPKKQSRTKQQQGDVIKPVAVRTSLSVQGSLCNQALNKRRRLSSTRTSLSSLYKLACTCTIIRLV